MADLERMGYLDHPHTSAGRVPTGDGYRHYVDSLVPTPLAARDAGVIESELAAGSPRELMEAASRLLSRLTHSVGFVMAPQLDLVTLRHIDLLRLPHPRVLVVMVARTGLVTSRLIEVDEPLEQDQLTACANYLNHHFAGLTLPAIRAHLLDVMQQEQALYDSLLKRVVAVGKLAFAAGDDPAADVVLDGARNVLDLPEFGDLERMRALLRALEEKGRLVRILGACLSRDGLRIVIGHEMPDPELSELALVAGRYPVDADGWGVGVVGCVRMEYARVMTLVDSVGRAVTGALRRLET
jgi:heat-inducible transcriptional repressor